jgi:glucose/arabinose dehydrogenase/PKD repeat protein
MPETRKLLLSSLALLVGAQPGGAFAAPVLPNHFEDSAVISGLSLPVAVRFDAGGNVFVAEKAGIVKRFDPLPSPGAGRVVLDLRAEVNSYYDRGLIGMVLHPDYPTTPYVYVLYAYDAPPGQNAPFWNDSCGQPGQPHPFDPGQGCPVSGRLARYTMTAGPLGPKLTDPLILIDREWYQQYGSHTVGDLAFGPDKNLYVSAGDGASFTWTDVGGATERSALYPNPADPLDDGGALRAQDLLTPGDPAGLNGAILRIDPNTGSAATGNPLTGGQARIIAFGLRNPFRMGFRPGTRELWITDVGWGLWEELNRIADVTDAVVENFGWPCYEGPIELGGYKTRSMCPGLINGTLPAGTPGTRTAPFFTYAHGKAPGWQDVNPCTGGGNAIGGVAFYGSGDYPPAYHGALFFADYAANCIYAMRVDSSGVPDPGQIDVLERVSHNPVSLEIGPEGDLYYTAIGTEEIRHIRYTGHAPTASASADVTAGLAPLLVQFDGSASVDPDGEALTYAWDLDGDGQFDDSTLVAPSYVYAGGTYDARLQVTDPAGKTGVSPAIQIAVDNTAPIASIISPLPSLTWESGQQIAFSGGASDMEDDVLPASALSWKVVLYHCPVGSCHAHPVGEFEGVAAGTFSAFPDGHPAHYEIELKVTDSGGLTDTEVVRIDARGSTLTLHTDPPGLVLRFAGAGMAAPFSVEEVVNASFPLEAPSPQSLGGVSYVFAGWSDGGPQARTLAMPAVGTSLTAFFDVEPKFTPPPIEDAGIPEDAAHTRDDGRAPLPPPMGGGGCSFPGGSSTRTEGPVLLLLAALGVVRRRRSVQP